MNPTIVGVAVVLLMLGLWTLSRAGGSSNTDAAEARRLVASGALLLDVRTPGEFEGGHVDGAKNIPVQSLEQRLGELGADRTRPIVVYCRSGARSSRAKALLEAAGFTRVEDLGAMSNWK